MVDYCPKYIEVMPSAAHDQEIGVSEMEMDMFDALMRLFMQRDDAIYCTEGRVRWRHFFESDILVTSQHILDYYYFFGVYLWRVRKFAPL